MCSSLRTYALLKGICMSDNKDKKHHSKPVNSWGTHKKRTEAEREKLRKSQEYFENRVKKANRIAAGAMKEAWDGVNNFIEEADRNNEEIAIEVNGVKK